MSDQERTRYYQYMRPRYSNPSFASSNVGASLGMLYVSQSIKQKPIMKISAQPQANMHQPSPQGQVQNNSSISQFGMQRSKSLLSNYGTSSLGTLPKFINERDIYEKQQKKYNIITIQPKQYNETIKKYPKYRLENMDQNYYKKLKLQDQYNQAYNKNTLNRGMDSNPQHQAINNQIYKSISNDFGTKSSIAQTGTEQSKKIVEDSNIRQVSENQERPKAFRPKMLNNIDELNGIV